MNSAGSNTRTGKTTTAASPRSDNGRRPVWRAARLRPCCLFGRCSCPCPTTCGFPSPAPRRRAWSVRSRLQEGPPQRLSGRRSRWARGSRSAMFQRIFASIRPLISCAVCSAVTTAPASRFTATPCAATMAVPITVRFGRIASASAMFPAWIMAGSRGGSARMASMCWWI